MKRLNLGADKREGGYLIVDLLIASVLLAVGIMVFFSSFATMGKGTLASKKKSVANTLAQEKMESLKGLTYHQLLATTNAVEDLNFPPSSRYRYDADRGTETLMEGGGSYLRRMLVTKSSETASGDSLSLPIGSVRDFGLKEIVVYVVWEENGDWKRFDLSGQIRNRDRKKMSAKVQGTLSVPTAPDGSGVTVRAMESVTSYAYSNAAGQYSISLEYGGYNFVFAKKGYITKGPFFFNVPENEITNLPPYTLDPLWTGTVSGQVKNGATPVSQAIVSINDGLSSSAITDSSGNFSIPGVATGTWPVKSYKGNLHGETTTAHNTLNLFNNSGLNVSVSASGLSVGYASGTIRDIYNTPLPGILVQAISSTTRTNAAGQYWVACPPSSGNMVVNGGFEQPKFLEISSNNVTVPLNSSIKVDFVLPPSSWVSGTITTNISAPVPLPGIPVDIVSVSGERKTVYTDFNGDFKSVDLSTGSFDIVPSLPSGAMSVPATRANVNVVASGVSGLDFSVTYAGGMASVQGHLTSCVGGAPITDGVILRLSTATLNNSDLVLSSSSWSGPDIVFTSNNRNGTYEAIVNPSAGAFHIDAWRGSLMGNRSFVDPVVIPVGGATDKDFCW